MAKKPIDFEWKVSGAGLTNIKLLISKDKTFNRIFESKDVQGTSLQFSAPRETGTYYWTLAGESNGVQIYGEKRTFSVVELRAINIIDPVFEFKKAGTWSVKAVLEELSQASNYRLQVSEDPSFTKPFIDQASPDNTPSLLFENREGKIYVRARVEYATIKEMAPWSDTVTFEIPEPPGTPALSFEAGHLNLLDLKWEPTKNTDSYRLELSEAQDFSRAEALEFKEPVQSVACLKNRFRFARANAHQNNGVYGEWSEPLLLPGCVEPLKILTAKLTPPYLARFKKKTQAELQFAWSGDTLAKDVTIEIAQDPSFKSPVKVVTRKTAVISDLKTRGRHYLRAIQNIDRKRYFVAYSVPFKIEETPYPKLVAPELKSPPIKETFLMRADAKVPVVLRWAETADSLGYDLQVSRDAEFSDLILEKSTKLTALKLSSKLDAEGSYFWRTRSYHQFETSVWSEARSFTVIYAK